MSEVALALGISRQAVWKARKLLAGCCQSCGKPRQGKGGRPAYATVCQRCARMKRDWNYEKYGKGHRRNGPAMPHADAKWRKTA